MFGLGVLFDVDAAQSGDVTTQVAPFHDHRPLAAVEHNRLRTYLMVIEWQDQAAG